ncbi:GMC oxidoreductase [Lophiostoma macrostomum CBS 122681]|uniref:GMC oxidoreductase n=1 Tax=Lophiostoma macrostomum CBS 122681 TaxID=1314788 RepID=A0A6A6SSW8_9PLEO|nr:GMC oxidoreductase [Lophiostoma macrostomum CBS 122681]
MVVMPPVFLIMFRIQDAAFDYVIVGGGTAGLTIANRLSEDPDVQVAVIEAGTFYQISNAVFSSTPAGCVLYAGASPSDTNPLVDWNFVTTPQAGANGRQLHYARGKALGGSSARNFMIYQRGDRGSYQRWADLVGDDSYTYDNWLPYFKRSTQFTPPKSPPRAANASAEYVDSAFSPPGSPLQISYANYAGPFSAWMERGLNAIGIPQAADFNSGSLDGSQYCSSTINPDDEKRASSQTAYYGADAQMRPNLKVYTLTLAQQIIFDEDKKATGVLIGTGAVLSARQEVIISAGAFQSPQLLMVSGIGPAATLQNLGIDVVADRPGVGQGMQDHIFFGPSYRVKVDTLTRLANDPVYLAAQFATDYTLLQQGVFTNPVADYLGWETAPCDLITPSAAEVLSSYPQSWPDIEYLSAPGYIGDFQDLLLQQPKDGYQYATILGAIVKPISRGNVTISSANTSTLPIVNPNWLTDPTDQSVALAIYKRVRAAFASSAMAPVLADPVEYFPGPDVQTDDQILDTIRESLHTVWHASCTCRMGTLEDPDAVVDSKARVIGISGLRVVDASSFALLPPGHPQSTVYALAEKIAQEIKDGN